MNLRIDATGNAGPCFAKGGALQAPRERIDAPIMLSTWRYLCTLKRLLSIAARDILSWRAALREVQN